jgi:hypothetical protein
VLLCLRSGTRAPQEHFSCCLPGACRRPPRADTDAGRGGAQAVTFLVIHQKHKKSLEEITNDLCPVLSVQQLYRISTMYWDDRYGTETVSHEARP